jgi:hypothetical protein
VYGQTIPATAEVLSGEACTQAWSQVTATAPVYAAYEKQTTRVTQLIQLRPKK